MAKLHLQKYRFPECNMGICQGAGRIAVIHENIPNMIQQIAKTLGEAGINITDMTNKSRKGVAYTLIDVEAKVPEEVVKTLEAISSVIRVRVVK